MRYGGYILIGLPFIIFASSVIEYFNLNKNKIYKITIFFIILSLVIFNYRNFVRINKEIEIYGYEPLKVHIFLLIK